jgi:hypothetical protein
MVKTKRPKRSAPKELIRLDRLAGYGLRKWKVERDLLAEFTGVTINPAGAIGLVVCINISCNLPRSNIFSIFETRVLKGLETVCCNSSYSLHSL